MVTALTLTGRIPVHLTTALLTFFSRFTDLRGPGSSVGMATELRAGRSGIESRWGRDFPPV